MTYIVQRVYCMFGYHKRSRGAAHNDPDAVRSVCRGCGVPMIKRFQGWEVDPHPEWAPSSLK